MSKFCSFCLSAIYTFLQFSEMSQKVSYRK